LTQSSSLVLSPETPCVLIYMLAWLHVSCCIAEVKMLSTLPLSLLRRWKKSNRKWDVGVIADRLETYRCSQVWLKPPLISYPTHASDYHCASSNVWNLALPENSWKIQFI